LVSPVAQPDFELLDLAGWQTDAAGPFVTPVPEIVETRNLEGGVSQSASWCVRGVISDVHPDVLVVVRDDRLLRRAAGGRSA
jgi:hypothetical protein